jgi:hypothetical protein
MKKFVTPFVIVVGVVFIIGGLLTGCRSDNASAPTSVIPETGTARIEGQLVADTGTQSAKCSSELLQDVAAPAGPVYPINGVTVQLLQNGTVLATTTTDEYGRFQFSDLGSGEYDVRVVSDDGAGAHYHVSVAAKQTMSVYGRALSGGCLWAQEDGPHWEDMPYGPRWGEGFQGASPGQGYWHDGERWCEPQSGTPQGTGPHGSNGPHH